MLPLKTWPMLPSCCLKQPISFLQVHELVEKAEVVRPGWNGYNIMHDSAARVAALDIGFLPSVSASQAPPATVVLLLGSDDYREEDIPQGAFVIYMVRHPSGQFCMLKGLHGLHREPVLPS